MKNSSIKIPEPGDPEKFRYDKYFERTVQYNRSRINSIRLYLSRECCDTDLHADCGCTIAITGSDGRLENSRTKMAVMVYTDNFLDFYQEVDSIREMANKCCGKEIFDRVKEIKNVDYDTLSYFRNEERKVFPSRVIDSLYMFGDTSMIKRAKKKLCEEITGRDGKRILEKLSKKRADYKRIMLSGRQKFKNKFLTHYSLEKGISYYNPSEGTASFKYGPLRFIQQSFARDVLKLIRNKGRSNITLYLPRDTKNRFDYILEEGVSNLSRPEVSDLIDSYMYFLWNYHRSQRRAEKTGTDTAEFDRTEVLERINSVRGILSKPVLKF